MAAALSRDCSTLQCHFRNFAALSKHHTCHLKLRSFRTRCSAATSQDLKLFSPSKVNLFLRVVRRRPDGFHDLASLFQVIDVGDSMVFSLLPNHDKDILTCNATDIPLDASNLVIKALDLFRKKSGLQQFFRVHLQKRVPHGAGLGGGSGNAATALWGANELTGRPATNEQLLEWSADIGSDISVFFSQGTAFCTGRGEIVEDVTPPLPLDTPLLLVKPPTGLATADIFRALDILRCSSADPAELLAQMAENGATAESCVNDLEAPAFSKLPELLELKEQLAREGGSAFSAVFMTGSGSTIVGVGSDAQPDFLRDPAFQDLFVSPARMLNRSPGQWYTPVRPDAES